MSLAIAVDIGGTFTDIALHDAFGNLHGGVSLKRVHELAHLLELDLNRNLLDLVNAAGLTEAEIAEFGRLQRKRIRRYGTRRR